MLMENAMEFSRIFSPSKADDQSGLTPAEEENAPGQKKGPKDVVVSIIK